MTACGGLLIIAQKCLCLRHRNGLCFICVKKQCNNSFTSVVTNACSRKLRCLLSSIHNVRQLHLIIVVCGAHPMEVQCEERQGCCHAIGCKILIGSNGKKSNKNHNQTTLQTSRKCKGKRSWVAYFSVNQSKASSGRKRRARMLIVRRLRLQ